jgi:hypothetical protein
MAIEDYRSLRVKRIGVDVEEELVLAVNGAELVCFASNPPANLEVGEAYSVMLNLLVLDDFNVTVLEDSKESSLDRLGDGFSYKITGQLIDGCLHSCGFEFKDEALETEFEYLNGKTIAMQVDRINVRFLKN